MYFESISWIKKLRELFCWILSVAESKCFLFLTEYKNDSLVQHPGSLVFEESWYSHLCIILPIPSYPHPVSLLGCKGCSLFDCGANAHTDSTLILILVWWILRNIIPRSSLAVSRFWEEVKCFSHPVSRRPKLMSLWAMGIRGWQKAIELLGTVTTGVRFYLGNRKASGI